MSQPVANPDWADSGPDAGRDSMVTRPRLLDALDKILDGRLALVIAPAGYGKTTLLTEWSQRRPAQTVWRTLGDMDNDPAHLLQGVCASLSTRCPDSLPALDASSPLSFALVVLFQQADRAASDPWLLVLDDYHLITNPVIHQALDTALGLSHLPVCLIIASRSLPPLSAIARLRMEGRLVELDEADLRFTPAETQSFMAASGFTLDESEARRITERTEGWPAALQLVRQAAQRAQRFDLPAILDRIGDERPLFDYLAGQVLDQQPGDVQDFLRRTSLLPYLSAELCNAFLGSANASAVLDALERNHLFISRLAERPGRCYRYHALFQDLMLRCLEQREGARAVENWRRRAAACLLEKQLAPAGTLRIDDHAAAIEHLLAARDWIAAAEQIETLAETLDFGALPRLEPWFERLPAGVMADRPRLLVALGRLRERQGRFDEALETLAQAEQAARRAETAAELGQAYRWQAWVRFRQARYTDSIALCRRALAALTGEPEADRPDNLASEQSVSELPAGAAHAQELANIYNILASCYGNLGDFEQQRQYHLHALQLFRRVGNREREAVVLHNMATFYLPQGLLQETIETEQTSLRILEELNSYRICFPLITLGQTYLQRGELETAQLVLERLLRLADAYQDEPRRSYALYLLGHLRREQGDAAAARRCYEEAWPIAEQVQEHFLCFELHQGRARLALDAGDVREARRQGQAALQRGRKLLDGQLEGQALATLGQVADAAGDTQQARAYYSQALLLVEKARARLDQAMLHLRLADLCRREGCAKEAMAHLGQALALSQEHGYDFLFTGRERERALPLLVAVLVSKYTCRTTAEQLSYSPTTLDFHVLRCPKGHGELVSKTSKVSEVCRLLTLIGAPAVEPLLELLDTASDDEVRTRAIQLLGEIGDERAAPALSRLRRERRLKEAVQAALARIAAAPRPPLRVLALGGFEVWRGGDPIPPAAWQPRRKARLLLLYLLGQSPRRLARDELLETLWPDLAPEAAGLALNTTFSDLRHILEPYLGKGQPSHYLTRDEETLAFVGEAWYDVAAFQQAVRAGGQAARRALELYRGDFLPEEPYTDWALRERERLRGLYLNTLTAWLEEQVQAGEWRQGADLARRILDLEPWLEEVWRALMLCLARLGRRSEALHAYQDCARALRAELDAAPSAETQALYKELKS